MPTSLSLSQPSTPSGILRNGTMLETHIETDFDTVGDSRGIKNYPEKPNGLNLWIETSPMRSNVSQSMLPESGGLGSGRGVGFGGQGGKVEMSSFSPHSPSKYRLMSSYSDNRDDENYPIRTPSGMCTPSSEFSSSPMKISMNHHSSFPFTIADTATIPARSKNTQRSD